MGYKNGTVPGHPVFQIMPSQSMNTCSGIKNDMGAVISDYFNAGCAAAVSYHLGRANRH
jgi:hypothetical protein